MKKALKIGWLVFAIILILFIGINIYLTYHFESIVKKQLSEQVDSFTKGLYHLKIDKIKLDFFDGNMKAEDITLYPDSTKLMYLKSFDSIPKHYANIKIKKIAFKGLDFRNYTQLRQLYFSSIEINSPVISITNNSRYQTASNDTIPPKPAPSLYEVISPVFDAIKVSQIDISNGRVDYCIEREKDTAIYVMENIKLRINDFIIDSLSRLRDQALYCEDFQFHIENAHHLLPGKAYALNIGKIGLGIKDSTLSVEKIQVVPQHSKQDFPYKTSNHEDWMSIDVGSIICSGIHFNDFFHNKSVKINNINIADVDFGNFKNQNFVKQHHRMPLIYESLQRLPIKLDIKNISVHNANVTYEELPKNGKIPGIISFTAINANFSDFTNIVSSHNQQITLKASGKLMNEGLINTTMKFPVDSLNDRFEINGTLGKISMLSLNKVVEPLAPVHIKQGYIQGMDFHISGGKYNADINMQLLYNGLKIDILKEYDKERHARSSQDFLSFWANGILKESNPDSDKEPRRVQSEYIRDPYHSSFNYLWKTFLSGIVETLGYTDTRQQQVSWMKKTWNKIKSIGHKDKKKEEVKKK